MCERVVAYSPRARGRLIAKKAPDV